MSTLNVTLQDIITAAGTIWGEARGEDPLGKLAVAWVIRNRASNPAWWGRTVTEVCEKPFQFSCRNPGDANCGKIARLPYIDIEGYDTCYKVAYDVFAKGSTTDPTDGATHYKVKGTKASWDKATEGKPRVEIGHHVFFNLGPSA